MRGHGRPFHRDPRDVRSFVNRHRQLLDLDLLSSKSGSRGSSSRSARAGANFAVYPPPTPGGPPSHRRPTSAGSRFNGVSRLVPRPPSAPRSSTASSMGSQTGRPPSRHARGGTSSIGSTPSSCSRPSTRPNSARYMRPASASGQSARPMSARDWEAHSDSLVTGDEELRDLLELVGMKAASKFKTPRQCFCNIDRGHTGHIGKEDLRVFLRSCSISEDVSDRVFGLLDPAGLGGVDYNTFTHVLGGYIQPGYPKFTANAAQVEDVPIRSAVDLSRHEAELRELAEAIGSKAHQKYRNAYECLRFMDEDKDGLVGRDEVASFVEAFGFPRTIGDAAFEMLAGLSGQSGSEFVDTDVFMDAFAPYIKPGYVPTGSLLRMRTPPAYNSHGSRPSSAERFRTISARDLGLPTRPGSAGYRRSSVGSGDAGSSASSAREVNPKFAILPHHNGNFQIASSANGTPSTIVGDSNASSDGRGSTPISSSGSDVHMQPLGGLGGTMTYLTSGAPITAHGAVVEYKNAYGTNVSGVSTASGVTGSGASASSSDVDAMRRQVIYRPAEQFKEQPYARPRQTASARHLARHPERSKSWDGPLITIAPRVKESVFARRPANKPATPIVGAAGMALRSPYDYFDWEDYGPKPRAQDDPYRPLGAGGTGWLKSLSSTGMISALAGGGGPTVRSSGTDPAARRPRPRSAGPTMRARNDDPRFLTSAGAVGAHLRNSAGGFVLSTGLNPFLVTRFNKKGGRMISNHAAVDRLDICPETARTVSHAIKDDLALGAPQTRWDGQY